MKKKKANFINNLQILHQFFLDGQFFVTPLYLSLKLSEYATLRDIYGHRKSELVILKISWLYEHTKEWGSHGTKVKIWARRPMTMKHLFLKMLILT